MSIKLGQLIIDSPFILSPMAGITHSPFRQLMREMGSPLVISELISADGIKYGGKKTLDLIEFSECERPFGLQLFGEKKEVICEAAQKVVNKGIDFIDFNAGCPVPKVCKKGAGSALLKTPLILAEILESLVKAVNVPVTLKIRTGWDENSRNAQEVVHIAYESGIRWVAIHGRTRTQGFSGVADWDYIARVKSKSKIPILGNGDICTPELAIKRLKEAQVDAVLIGRGILKNPFLFQQSNELLNTGAYKIPEPEDYISVMEKQWALSRMYLEHTMALLSIKKFISWYVFGLPGCHEFRKRVFALNNAEHILLEGRTFFRSQNK